MYVLSILLYVFVFDQLCLCLLFSINLSIASISLLMSSVLEQYYYLLLKILVSLTAIDQGICTAGHC